MAKIVVNLRAKYSFQYDHIKRVLQELGKLDSVMPGDQVDLYLPEVKDASEFVLTLIWTKMHSLKEFPCKKTVFYPQGSQEAFDQRSFLDRLVGERKRSSLLRVKTIPFNYNTFKLTEDETITTKQAIKIVQEISEKFLEEEVRIHISELVANAFHHSAAQKEVAVLCKVNLESGYLDFCIADQGRGIKPSFLANKAIAQEYRNMEDAEVIEKATERGVTCNPTKAKQYANISNSGIGLYFLQKFCVSHGGHLVIISQKGYYYADSRKGGRVKKKRMSTEWNGTAVNFRVNLDISEKRNYALLKKDFVSEFENNISFQ